MSQKSVSVRTSVRNFVHVFRDVRVIVCDYFGNIIVCDYP